MREIIYYTTPEMSATDSSQLFFDVQQKTDKQHILDNPDTYIGSVENIDADMWIMSEDDDKKVYEP